MPQPTNLRGARQTLGGLPLRSLVSARQARYGPADLRGDVLGGVTAGVVSLPLAMGYGVLSGLGPAAGLYGAFATALISSIVGGARGVIAGPNVVIAMVMAVVVTDTASSLAEAATIGVLAGLIQLVFVALRLGRYVAYVPQALISGFFTAFGLLVIASQVSPALGIARAGVDLIDNLKALPAAVDGLNSDAFTLAALCLVIGLLWRGRLTRLCSASFAVLLFGTALGTLWLDAAPTIGEIPLGLPSLELSAVSADFLLRAIEPAFTLALLSSISILLVALSADVITGDQHQPNRTLFGVGLANIGAALIGGIPGAANSATMVNIFGGGRTVVAGLALSGLLLAVMAFMGPIVEHIPLAVLAAILIALGWNLIDWRFLRRIHRIPFSFSLVMIVTCILVMFTSHAAALMVGLAVAWLIQARRTETSEVQSLMSVPLLDAAVLDRDELSDDGRFEARSGLIVLPDRVSAASARQISRILRADLAQHRAFILDMSRTRYMDDSAAVMIGELLRVAKSRGDTPVIISGMSDDRAGALRSMSLLDEIPEAHIATDLGEAKEALRRVLLSLD